MGDYVNIRILVKTAIFVSVVADLKFFSSNYVIYVIYTWQMLETTGVSFKDYLNNFFSSVRQVYFLKSLSPI